MKSVCSHNPDFLTPAENYQLNVYYADALYEQEEYRKAEVRNKSPSSNSCL